MVHDSQFVKREVVNNYSLLYSIQGSTPGKLPYLLASHLDVVPADPKTWEVPPFSGNIINKTYIYGRGAIDDKSGVLVSFITKIMMYTGILNCQLIVTKGYIYNHTKSAVNEVLFWTN